MSPVACQFGVLRTGTFQGPASRGVANGEEHHATLEAIEGRRLKLGDKHPHTLESMNNLIDLYESWNKPENAKEWRTKLPRELAIEE